MSDLLIRNVDFHRLSRLRASARDHGRSVSEEAQVLLRKALRKPIKQRRMGDALMALIPDEARGDDLVFEISDYPSTPPDFSE
jgi:plasmid stability protein